ncbi:MAG: hypothetical protein QM777_01570 [Pseudorhodoferax sp.]
MEKQMKKKADYPVVPHAYSFVYHQIMGDEPPPHVPVLMNLSLQVLVLVRPY